MKLLPKEEPYSASVRGSIDPPDGEFGFSDYGVGEYGSSPACGIYQQRKLKEGIGSIKIKSYPYVITHTEVQQPFRDKFKAGIIAWKALSSEEKAEWNEEAKPFPLYGISLFLRNFMLA